MVSTLTRSLVISCPAKLNLYLDILTKRPDGYHDLVTLFERISLADSVRLIEFHSNEIVITFSDADSSTQTPPVGGVFAQPFDKLRMIRRMVSGVEPDSARSGVSFGLHVPADRSNLCYRAADLLRSSLGIKRGVKIELTKNIPVGAGLGGGSSDAAAVLIGLNKIFGLKLNRETLVSYANRLGSDVAFFILNRKFALGEGRGGDLRPLSMPQDLVLWHVLFVLPLKVLTKDVYNLLDNEENLPGRLPGSKKSLKLTKKGRDVNILISHLKKKDIFLLNQNVYNRLSATVIKSYSLISELKTDLLKSGLTNVHMSGSGSTLFTIFSERSQAEKVFQEAERRFSHRCRILLAHTV